MLKGKALVFSAPSGSGKTTIVRHLLSVRPDLKFSVSATTRPPREYEMDGEDYHFLSRKDFEDKISRKELLEWEEVYDGIYYGTLRSEVTRIHDQGYHVVFDVDVVGGANIKKTFGDGVLAVFIKVGSIESLIARLKGRGTETEESLKMRVEKAQQELQYEKLFDVTLINEDLDHALKQAETIVSNYLDN